MNDDRPPPPDDAVGAFLAAAAGEGGAARRHETHISQVFVGPRLAFKRKKAVRLPYLDFSTPERRLAFCEREQAINARAAPALYLGARAIRRRADGALGFDGEGPLVDACLVMTAFPEGSLLADHAARGPLPDALVDRLAEKLVAYHAGAPVSTDGGGRSRMARVLAINAAGFVASGLLEAAPAAALAARFAQALDAYGPLLEARARAGFVRRCHGDLHLANICLLDGEPTPFDALEFDEDLATTDVLYDLAFLAMDLWRRGRRAEANRLVNRYADGAGEREGLALLPFFVAVRAAVRAHVTAAADGQEEAAAYLALAQDALEPRGRELLAVGGLSGSGKSTLAAALAPHLGAPPGARVLNSDRLRKALAGLRADEKLPPEAYTTEAGEAVYRALRTEAAALLAAHVPVVADAVHAGPEERAAIAAVARAAGARFRGVWLDLDPASLKARVAARVGGPSDATPVVVERQLAYDLGAIDWLRLSAGRDIDALLTDCRSVMELG